MAVAVKVDTVGLNFSAKHHQASQGDRAPKIAPLGRLSLSCPNSDQLTLPFRRDLAVVRLGRLNRGVAEVLAESLVILERDTNRLTVSGQRVAKRMRIEIRNAHGLERLSEDRSDWR